MGASSIEFMGWLIFFYFFIIKIIFMAEFMVAKWRESKDATFFMSGNPDDIRMMLSDLFAKQPYIKRMALDAMEDSNLNDRAEISLILIDNDICRIKIKGDDKAIVEMLYTAARTNPGFLELMKLVVENYR